MSAKVAGLLALATVAALAAPGAAAQDARERGHAIVREMEQRSRGYGDFEADLLMRVENGDRERLRKMRVRGLEAQDGDRTRIVLERPADLARTEFLSVLAADGSRSQWIYLPTARRVRRISGSQASDSFLGSHFTFDDMSPPSMEGFSYRWIRDEDVSGLDAVLVERIRRGGAGGYPRQLLWIDLERYLLHRVEYFDGGGARRRSLDIADYREIGGFWRAGRMTMVDLRDGGSTTLEWTDLRLGVGLTARDFDPARLGR